MPEPGPPGSKQTVLTNEQIAEYRAAFQEFDANDNGSLTVAEVGAMLTALGKDITNDELHELFRTIDINGDQNIDFDEFISLMEIEFKSSQSERFIREAFAVFDEAGDGHVTTEKLKQVIQTLECGFSEEELDEMIQYADEDGTGRVNYEGLIGLLSFENETLLTAYKKRERIEANEPPGEPSSSGPRSNRSPVPNSSQNEVSDGPEVNRGSRDNRSSSAHHVTQTRDAMVQSNISNGISVGGTTVPTRNINNYNSGDDTSNVTNQAGKASRPNAHVDTRKTYTSEVLKNKKQITVPTMAEIASQYEPEHYNKFSRKVPPGAKDVASYGEKKNIGYSNGMIATSVQKTQPRASDVKTNIDVTNQKKSRLTGGKDEIIDERIAFERKIQKENQKPAGYARAQVAKFYKDPSYYLKKRTSISPTQWDMSKTDIQFERPQRHGKGVHSSVTSIDGNKRSRRPSLVDKVTSRSADFTGSVTNRSGMTTLISFYRRGVSLGQQNRKETTAVVHGEKMYHSLWRKAFSNALEKMKENKTRRILLSTPVILDEEVEKRAHDRKRAVTWKPRRFQSVPVVSPSLDDWSSTGGKSSPDFKFLARGSYSERFKQQSGQQVVMRQQQQQYEQQQQRRLAIVKERDTTSPSLSPVIPKRSTIVTKSGLNRMFNIQV